MQWNHMIKGNRNSFQTPILTGMEEVKWIPLTQSHSDMEFTKWMNYLIKLICGIFQIDPLEIGFGMKEEGGGGSGMSGDNTKEKLDASRSKGFKPMLKFLANYINKNFVSRMDPEFEFEFVGVDSESQKALTDREKEEANYKLTVNEVRERSGLDPIAGFDDIILNSDFLGAYEKFNPNGKKFGEEQRMNQQADQMTQQVLAQTGGQPGMQKSMVPVVPMSIEYYTVKKD